MSMVKQKKKRDFEAKDLVIPIWKALLAVAIYFLVIALLWLLARLIQSELLDITVDVMFRLFYIVFFLSIVTSYANHFKKLSGVSMITPALNALSSTIIFYFLAYLFRAMGKALDIIFIDRITALVTENILAIFALLLCVFYIFYLAERSS